MIRSSPISTLFPYTTLFRSQNGSIAAVLADQYVNDIITHTQSAFVATSMGVVQLSDTQEVQWLIKGEDVQTLYYHEDNEDRKSTRLNSSHVRTSYAVFCLKK